MSDAQVVAKMPEGYEDALGPFRACVFDSCSGEPIGWGFEIVKHLGKEKFEALRAKYYLECLYPTWYVVVKALGHKEAVEKYGPVTAEERGPRGGGGQ